MEIYDYVKQICEAANSAKTDLAAADTKVKNGVLSRIAELLRARTAEITAATESCVIVGGGKHQDLIYLRQTKRKEQSL